MTNIPHLPQTVLSLVQNYPTLPDGFPLDLRRLDPSTLGTRDNKRHILLITLLLLISVSFHMFVFHKLLSYILDEIPRLVAAELAGFVHRIWEVIMTPSLARHTTTCQSDSSTTLDILEAHSMFLGMGYRF